MAVIAQKRIRTLHRNPFDDVSRNLLLPAIVEPRGPGIGMAEQILHVFEGNALKQEVGRGTSEAISAWIAPPLAADVSPSGKRRRRSSPSPVASVPGVRLCRQGVSLSSGECEHPLSLAFTFRR